VLKVRPNVYSWLKGLKCVLTFYRTGLVKQPKACELLRAGTITTNWPLQLLYALLGPEFPLYRQSIYRNIFLESRNLDGSFGSSYFRLSFFGLFSNEIGQVL
jgi:hypothetical protein